MDKKEQGTSKIHTSNDLDCYGIGSKTTMTTTDIGGKIQKTNLRVVEIDKGPEPGLIAEPWS